MATFQKFENFVEQLGNGVHNLKADTLKLMLTNSAPAGTDVVKADLTEIAAGNGYTAGGAAVANVTYVETGGVAALDGDDVVFTASGGSFGPFRYAVLYNDTAAAKDLIGFWDHGSEVTTAAGETFKVAFHANGILMLG